MYVLKEDIFEKDLCVFYVCNVGVFYYFIEELFMGRICLFLVIILYIIGMIFEVFIL